MINKIIFLFLLIVTSASYGQYETTLEQAVGSRYSVLVSDQKSINKDVYYEQKSKTTLNDKTILNTDFTTLYSLKYQEEYFEFNDLFIEYTSDNLTLKSGSQHYSFSETFGTNITDIMNPRDYQNFILDSMRWQRLPVWSFMGLHTLESSYMQFIFTPLPRKNHFLLQGVYNPYGAAGVTEEDSTNFKIFKDAETAIRIGKTFESGFDLNLLAAFHQNRTPVGNVDFITKKIIWKYDRVLTGGLSFSFVKDSFVIRGDAIHTRNDMVMDNLTIVQINRTQTISGVDYTLEGTTLGFQHHYDSYKSRHAASGLISSNFYDNLIPVSLMYFRGINYDDSWLQLKIGLNRDSWQINLIADLLDGKIADQGIGLFKSSDRILTELKIYF